MNSRITQSDIARRAGVHRTTVSLALRNHPSIPVLTRQRIRLLAESLAYRPDPALNALIAYRSNNKLRKITATLAYITNWHSRSGWRSAPAHADFYHGAAERAEQLGYRLEHFWCGDYADCPARLGRVLEARGIRGVILASHVGERTPLLEIDWSTFSVVKIDSAPSGLLFDTVTNDQRRVVQTCLQHTLALGYRRIGLVLPARWDEGAELAWSAGLLAIQAHLPRADQIPALFYPTPAVATSAADMLVPSSALAAWLVRHEPDAIIGFAPYVLPTLCALSRQIRCQFGFADVLLARRECGLAGIHQNCVRVGEVATERVAQLLSHNVTGVPSVPVWTLVEGTWCPGESLPLRTSSRAWLDADAPAARWAASFVAAAT